MEADWYIFYSDEGPVGPCGQSCYITSPWRRLYTFSGTYSQVREHVERMCDRRSRRRPRVELFVSTKEQELGTGFPVLEHLND